LSQGNQPKAFLFEICHQPLGYEMFRQQFKSGQVHQTTTARCRHQTQQINIRNEKA